MERKIKVLKGRSKTFDIFVQDSQGNPKDLTGYSLIRLEILHSNGTLKKYAPKSAGADEEQKIDLKAPDAGSFKLQFGDEITGSLAFNVSAAALQAALNGLNELSGVVVTDNGSGDYDVSFEGNDGKRQHPLLVIYEHDLTNSGSSVDPEVIETVEGQEPSGIEVVEEKCGHLKISLSTDDVALLSVKNDQDMDLYVRIGTDDLDIDPEFLRGVLDVSDFC